MVKLGHCNNIERAVTQNMYGYQSTQTQSTNSGKLTAQEAAQALNQFFSSIANMSQYVSATDSSSSDNSVSTDNDSRQAVIDLLKDARPNVSNSKHFDKIVKQYDLYKKMHEGWTDAQITKRLCQYQDALISHDIQVTYGETYKRMTEEYLHDNNKTYGDLTDDDFNNIAKSCQQALDIVGIKDNDSKIKKAIDENDNSMYIQTIVNRGQGFFDMYDADGDGKVTMDEFRTIEQTDAQTTGIEYDENTTQDLFNFIDKDGKDGIDVKEMTSYQYAVSRMHDTNNNHTENDITFSEWYDAQFDTQHLGVLRDSIYEAQIDDFYDKD